MSQQNIAHKSEKVITNKQIKQINDKYETKIIKGEIQVTHNASDKKLTASQLYDKAMKQKKLMQAQQQKHNLIKKIDSLNKSIETIKKYNFNSARAISNSEVSRSQSPVNPLQILKKQKQMLQKFKQENKKIQKLKTESMKRKQQRQNIQRKVKQDREQVEKAKKKQQIYQNIQKIKKRMQNRQSDSKQQDETIKRIVEKQTLFKKLQEEYAKKESSILEERKKKLANIRNLHKPINLSEIKEHQRTFFQALKEKESMRQRQRRITTFQEEYRVSYKSPLHRSLSKSRNQQIQNQSKIKATKMKQFAQHVRQNFIPAISEHKRQELQKKIEEQNEKRQKYIDSKEQQCEKSEQTRQIGLRYLQQIKELPKKRDNVSRLQPQNDRVQYKNYLTHSQNSNNSNWRAILQSKQSKKDKAYRLHHQSQKFQRNLLLKEQKARLLKNTNNDQIDQEYFEMIKAKLQLLQN